MLRITRLTDYATLILGHMAQDPIRLYSSKQLAQDLSLGSATVSKLLKILSSHQIVLSVRGAEGGYKLAKAPEEISVVAIIQAIEGPLGITECALVNHGCSQIDSCGVQTHWQKINGVIFKALSTLSLADMVKPAEELK